MRHRHPPGKYTPTPKNPLMIPPVRTRLLRRKRKRLLRRNLK
jgi:hypothetical protein